MMGSHQRTSDDSGLSLCVNYGVREVRERLMSHPGYRRMMEGLTNSHAGAGPVFLKNTPGSLKSFLIAEIFLRRSGGTLVYLSANREECEELRDDIESLLGEGHVAFLPPVPAVGGSSEQWDAEHHGARLEVLQSLDKGIPRVVILPILSLFSPIPEKAALTIGKLKLTVGGSLGFSDFLERLAEMRYEREVVVEYPGEFAVRGGIVDIFPFSRENPLRLELFDDVIESIREFDTISQRSIGKIDEVIVYNDVGLIKSGRDGAPDDERSGEHNFGRLLHYFPADTILMIDEPEHFAGKLFGIKDGTGDEWKSGREMSGGDCSGRLYHLIRAFDRVFCGTIASPESNVVDFGGRPHPTYGGNFELLKQHLEERGRATTEAASLTVMYTDTPGQKARVASILEGLGVDEPRFFIQSQVVRAGFELPEQGLHILTDHQFFGRGYFTKKRRWKQKLGTPIHQLSDLKARDFVVHVDHGIGIYDGLERITIAGHETECIRILYQDRDKLYVPLDRLNRIQKYTSRESIVPKIHKLGSADWSRLKARTRKRIKSIAHELIQIYAARKAMSGFAFNKDSLLQRELEASFPYEDTPDQFQACQDVKEDMESPRPMDRLICGDVGYGKTEVALRAAFKAANDSKQSAILVPTTILAQQHYETLLERFENFPINIELLSRFRSQKEQKRIISELKSGHLDIVVGTHRLLSKDVEFKDLGLLIIDEEHRFGVQHKEKLRRKRATVDVLSLTATPIPRTLHMGLIGARDMSMISTPPRDRLPVYTEILPFDSKFIRNAILREVHRGGQVFFVHNRVMSIDAMADYLRRLIPEIKIEVGHGQMHERELERVMHDFYHKRFHCLVATMIIESGLDLPNVNTIIINRADRFGVAQLYQLRGRVGRSTQRAYAYMMVPRGRHINRDALRRLQTIEQFSDLGSGYQIAMRDLEIRGAGNLLGAEQSGFVDALGFEMYCKILDEAVAELKGEKTEANIISLSREDIAVELDCDVFLPQDFVERSEDRVDLYRRLVAGDELAEVADIGDEMRDRFGPLPEPARNLMYFVSFKLLGERLGFCRIQVRPGHLWAEFDHELLKDGGEALRQRLGQYLENATGEFTFVQDKGLGIRMALSEAMEDALEEARNFLQSMT